jgi:translation initiation factor 3 subunit I
LGKENNPDVTKLTPTRNWEFKDFKITQASWNFMNKSVIAASSDGELALLDVETGTTTIVNLGNFINRVKVHEGEIKQFSIAKDYSLMATAANDGCKVFDPDNLKQLRYFKYEVPMNAVAISPLLSEDKNAKPHLIVAGGILIFYA